MNKTQINLHQRVEAAFRIVMGSPERPMVYMHRPNLEGRKKRFDDACLELQKASAGVKSLRESAHQSQKELLDLCTHSYNSIKINQPELLPNETVSDSSSTESLRRYAGRLITILERCVGQTWADQLLPSVTTVLSKAKTDAKSLSTGIQALRAAHKEQRAASKSMKQMLSPLAASVRVVYGADSEEYRTLCPPRKHGAKAEKSNGAKGDKPADGQVKSTESNKGEAKDGGATQAAASSVDSKAAVTQESAANDSECQSKPVASAA